MFCIKCWLAQMAAFSQVLDWINSQETQYINKKILYTAVLEMRPDEELCSGCDFKVDTPVPNTLLT
jgi:hypothetical protein